MGGIRSILCEFGRLAQEQLALAPRQEAPSSLLVVADGRRVHDPGTCPSASVYLVAFLDYGYLHCRSLLRAAARDAGSVLPLLRPGIGFRATAGPRPPRPPATVGRCRSSSGPAFFCCASSFSSRDQRIRRSLVNSSSLALGDPQILRSLL